MPKKLDYHSMPATIRSMLAAANLARMNAYAPYSNDFFVGASVLTLDGEKIFSGCNVEDAAFTGAHAEASAIGEAVKAGYKKFSKILIVGGYKGSKSTELTFPCGSCRQKIFEFSCLAGNDVEVIMSDIEGKNMESWKISELLPKAFGPKALGKQ